jgi:hypothetical protein
MKRRLSLSNLFKAKKAALGMRVIPDGADKPLPPLPATVEIDPDDDGEVKLWDRLMPKFRGILNARVKNKQRFDE